MAAMWTRRYLRRMTDDEAIDLLRPAVGDAAGTTWADLGAGTGVFTRALAALIGDGGRVIAVDADARALAALRAWAARPRAGPSIDVMHADVTRPLPLPPLDGVLLANALHFVRDQAPALALAAGYLRPAGRLVLIEYEGRRPSPWVPHPVSLARFRDLAAAARLTPPERVATRPSAYGGTLYVAVTHPIP